MGELQAAARGLGDAIARGAAGMEAFAEAATGARHRAARREMRRDEQREARKRGKEMASAFTELAALLAEARVAYFDELVTRGLTPRGAYLAILRVAGYL